MDIDREDYPEPDVLAGYRRLGIDVKPGADPYAVAYLLGDGKLWGDRLHHDKVEVVPEDLTVGGQITRWLAIQETRVHAGKDALHFDNRRRCLVYFRNWIGETNPITSINESKVEEYYTHLLEKAGERRKDPKTGWSKTYGGKMAAVLRVFVKYLWTKRLIDLPRNLDTTDFDNAPKAVPTATVEEFRTLGEHATGQLKLHLLLMANCGMTQVDISELRRDEVDLENGRITRKRVKTEDHEYVPVVSYKLWASTWELLRRYCEQKGEFALRTTRGTRWVWEELVNGKYRSSDNIASNYTHLRAKLAKKGISTKSLKQSRKTSASLVESHKEYGLGVTRLMVPGFHRGGSIHTFSRHPGPPASWPRSN